MLELAMHILDIVENSVRAGAEVVSIRIKENKKEDAFIIEILDNGSGMDSEMMNKAINPFTTTKAGKKVGLGLPLLSEAAKKTGGGMTVDSSPGEGTLVTATFGLSHIDRQPLGDMVETMVTLIIGSPDVEFELVYNRNGEEVSWDTGDLYDQFDHIQRSSPDVMKYIRTKLDFINDSVF